jgi:hypothetical protein
MSIELRETLELSQRTGVDHVHKLQARHKRIYSLLEATVNELTIDGATPQVNAKLVRIFRLYDRYTMELIAQIHFLQEDRNMSYFSMRDLEEILFLRKKGGQ